MQLTGDQRRHVQQVFLTAFPTRANLEQLVSFAFNTSLDALTSGGNLTEATLQLIGWAEAHGRLADLLRTAAGERPDNPAIRDLPALVVTDPATDQPAPAATADHNPFYGDSSQLFGRAGELNRVWGKLRAGNHCSIVGPPGSGKTLLMKEIAARAPQQLGWQPSEWVLVHFRTVNTLRDLQQEIVQELGGTRPAQLRGLLRAQPLRLLALDDLGWMGAGNEGLKMRRWLRGFAEDNTIQLLITSNKQLDILFRADDPTVDSPFENLDRLPVLLGPLAPEVCRAAVGARLSGTPFTVNHFADLLQEPRQPKELLNLCIARYEQLCANPQ